MAMSNSRLAIAMALICAFAVTAANRVDAGVVALWSNESGNAAPLAAQLPMGGQYPPKPKPAPRSNRACVERCAIRCRSVQGRCRFTPGRQNPGFCTAQGIQCRSSCAAGCN
ncbi:MAG: hypothetical protein SGJ17_08520 [Hyphomicrobiales bacterium]|nr:hypothetical protein [Hyphomicrobiales bacterium]